MLQSAKFRHFQSRGRVRQ